MKIYDPAYAIPPQPMLRRRGKKKTHLADSPDHWEEFTACAACAFTIPVRLTAYNAAEVACNECLLNRLDSLLRTRP